MLTLQYYSILYIGGALVFNLSNFSTIRRSIIHHPYIVQCTCLTVFSFILLCSEAAVKCRTRISLNQFLRIFFIMIASVLLIVAPTSTH